MPVPRRTVKDPQAQSYLDDLTTETERIKESWWGPQPPNPTKGQLWFDPDPFKESLSIYSQEPTDPSANFVSVMAGDSVRTIGALLFVDDWQIIGATTNKAVTSVQIDIASFNPSFGLFGKIYHVPLYVGEPYDEWKLVLPVHDGGPDADGVDFILEVMKQAFVGGDIHFFRIRKTEGPSAVTGVAANIKIHAPYMTTGQVVNYETIEELLPSMDISGTDSSAPSAPINSYLLRTSDIGDTVQAWSAELDTWSGYTMPASDGDPGDVLTTDGSGGLSFAPSGGGVDNFLDLTDTPNAYTSQAGKLVRVNSTPNALEFVDPSALPVIGGGSSSQLIDSEGAENDLEELLRWSRDSGAIMWGLGVAHTTGRTVGINEGRALIDGRVTHYTADTETITASRDAYIYLNPHSTGSGEGTVEVVEVANGATSGMEPTDGFAILLAKVVTNASVVTSVTVTGFSPLGQTIAPTIYTQAPVFIPYKTPSGSQFGYPMYQQCGWDFINNDGSEASIKSISFPVKFFIPLGVNISVAGADTDDPTAITDATTDAITDSVQRTVGYRSLTATGFQAVAKRTPASSGNRTAFFWHAFGFGLDFS